MEWTEGSVRELMEIRRKNILGPKSTKCILTKLESKMNGRNWGKK
jgi:hypothetical protein